MDAKGEEKLGTGLTDVIRLLLDLPNERLLSLTYQLGKTPEEVLVRALSLLFLCVNVACGALGRRGGGGEGPGAAERAWRLVLVRVLVNDLLFLLEAAVLAATLLLLSRLAFRWLLLQLLLLCWCRAPPGGRGSDHEEGWWCPG